MAFRAKELTLTGSAQALSAILATIDLDVPITALILQPKGTNANVVYVGGSDVSNTRFAFRLEAGATGVPPAPFVLELGNEGRIRLSDIYVLGTNTETLQIGMLY